MPNNIYKTDYLSLETTLGLLAILGGAANYATAFLKGEPFSGSKLFASIFVGGFAGLLFGHFGIALGIKSDMLLVFSGVGGFSGKTSMDYLFAQITNKSDNKNI